MAAPSPVALVWFRRDLRVADNPALSAAIKSGFPVEAVYIHDEARYFSPGGAQKWMIHHTLCALEPALAARGVRLRISLGTEEQTLVDHASEIGAAAVFWNRRYSSEDVATDKRIKERLAAKGVAAHSFNGALLREPWEVKTGTGGPYRVFTPFWKALAAAGPSRLELAAPPTGRAPLQKDQRAAIDALGLLPTAPDWASEFPRLWAAGESGAHAALADFIDNAASAYSRARDIPAVQGTSLLSPYLAIGAISPLTVWNAIDGAMKAGRIAEKEALKFLSEIAWREFSTHLLFHFPTMARAPWRAEFSAFPWRDDEAGFRRWTQGKTGVPIVDAGMRELWRTGWMHNRVRMIVASFLVKNLMIDWRKGERWFWDTLLDADPASNVSNWQWVAGSGADAAPYFRIFNPVLQGERYDPDGAYVRRYVPEIAALPNNLIHAPWKAPNALLLDYPPPLVDPAQSRRRALSAYQEMRSAAQNVDFDDAAP